MAGKTIDDNEEIGGFNPERRNEKPKETVGPAPTDDPGGNVEQKIEEGLTKLPPG